ncbi:MAG: TM1812 family CRISPR-associated protein, partial [Candidatus Jordarchaeaceae archaeon]
SLFDWTVAIDRYLKTGNAQIIKEVGIEQLKPLLKKTRGEEGSGLRRLINALDSFSREVPTCRGPNLKPSIERILESLPMAEGELEKLKPFSPLIEKIRNRFSALNISDAVTCGLEVAEWCLENNLLQQGFTILRETILNHIIIKILGSNDVKKKSNREIAETMLNSEYEKIPKEILKLWQEIIDYRNDINHGGWREQNFHTENDFRQKLQEFTEKAKNLLA